MIVSVTIDVKHGELPKTQRISWMGERSGASAIDGGIESDRSTRVVGKPDLETNTLRHSNGIRISRTVVRLMIMAHEQRGNDDIRVWTEQLQPR